MNREIPPPPAFWKTVGLLLRAARVRSHGRRNRQRQLLNNKTGKSSPSALGILGLFGAVFIGLLIHGSSGFLLYTAVDASQRYQAESQGKIVVSNPYFIRGVIGGSMTQDDMRDSVKRQAERIAEHYGGRQKDIETRIWADIRDNGGANLISEDAAEPGLKHLTGITGLPQMVGSLMLLLWLVMMVCQGEGMELDLNRRRHPMWEWLLSHPVQPGAVFLAEMLMPLSANSIYWFGPVYVGVIYGLVYGFGLGLVAVFLAGIPVTIGAACLGKAIEIGVMIRFSPRSRGGILGILSWLGYALLLFSFAGFYMLPRLIMAAGKILSLLAAFPWPWLGLFLGGGFTSEYNFLAGITFCWALGIAMTVAGVGFSLWGTAKGLSGSGGRADTVTRRTNGKPPILARNPLYRKEFLWFLRDRSAIVQAILIPITAAGYQLFNMRSLLAKAQGEWNYLCGAAICFGTYFLWVLGPKSLASEGAALWIPLTWPTGLEGLLKAKAWLWAMISTGIVLLVMLYAAILFPADIWKIALILIGWFFFARSMAEKSVTLVTVASSSGEAAKIPMGRRFATQMGMLTFSIGVITQQWHLAIVGIVFSYITAAAMWQNFRARLPYLYDPWSEQLPPPPTAMHAMVAISVMLEVTSILTMIIAAFGGKDNLGIAMLFGYGISSVVVSFFTMKFLYERNVPPSRIFNWPAGALATEALPSEESEAQSDSHAGSILWANYTEKPKFTFKPLLADLTVLLPWIAMGAFTGGLLGLLAHQYVLLLHHLPWISDILRQSEEKMASQPDVKQAYGILAVCFAPFAEEYLFRGLLYRALDREWGGWKAVLGSAAFFTVYHPTLAWIPVFTVGAVNAILFKKSGKLLPAIALHMAYNLVVTLLS
jgi:membrane protease YdiL (CAAX protease family)